MSDKILVPVNQTYLKPITTNPVIISNVSKPYYAPLPNRQIFVQPAPHTFITTTSQPQQLVQQVNKVPKIESQVNKISTKKANKCNDCKNVNN